MKWSCNVLWDTNFRFSKTYGKYFLGQRLSLAMADKVSFRVLTEDEKRKLEDDSRVVSDFKQNKLEKEAQKNWDLFYKRNTTNFFKDRHWTTAEFKELLFDSCEVSKCAWVKFLNHVKAVVRWHISRVQTKWVASGSHILVLRGFDPFGQQPRNWKTLPGASWPLGQGGEFTQTIRMTVTRTSAKKV